MKYKSCIKRSAGKTLDKVTAAGLEKSTGPLGTIRDMTKLRKSGMGEVGQEWASIENTLGRAGGLSVEGGKKEGGQDAEGGYMGSLGWFMGGHSKIQDPGQGIESSTPDRYGDRDAGEVSLLPSAASIVSYQLLSFPFNTFHPSPFCILLPSPFFSFSSSLFLLSSSPSFSTYIFFVTFFQIGSLLPMEYSSLLHLTVQEQQ